MKLSHAFPALLGALALSSCTHVAVEQSLYDSLNNRSSMRCETLPDTERTKCKELEAVEYREYKAQREAAMGTTPAASSGESFEDFQKRREQQR